jgi:hypothetical protein
MMTRLALILLALLIVLFGCSQMEREPTPASKPPPGPDSADPPVPRPGFGMIRIAPPLPVPVSSRRLDSLYGRDIQALELSFARHLGRGEVDIVALDLDLVVPRPRFRAYGVVPRAEAQALLRALQPRPVGYEAAVARLAHPGDPADLLTLCGVEGAAGGTLVRVYSTPIMIRVDPFGPPRPARDAADHAPGCPCGGCCPCDADCPCPPDLPAEPAEPTELWPVDPDPAPGRTDLDRLAGVWYNGQPRVPGRYVLPAPG